MAKKMKLPFLFKPKYHHSKPSWLSRSCSQPRTLSFRDGSDNIFRTINSAYLETSEEISPESTASDGNGNEQIEAMVRELRYGERRLFVELEKTSSITKQTESVEDEFIMFRESVVLSIESREPYKDFRKSMGEIVEVYGVKDWEGMEKLLSWYLKANVKRNHQYVIEAFVDLLVGFVFDSKNCFSFCCSSNSATGLSSSCCSSGIGGVSVEEIECSSTSPCLSSLFEDDEDELSDFNIK